MIDLIGDETNPTLGAVGDDLLKGSRAHHAASGIGGRGHEKPGDLAARRIDQRRRGLKPGFGTGGKEDGLQSEGRQDVAIGRVGRGRQGHPVAGIERAEVR